MIHINGKSIEYDKISGVDGKVEIIDTYSDVPAIDTADNNIMRDVIGNRDDTAADSGSVIAMLKKIIEYTAT